MELNFNELASGAVSEQINKEIQRVFENIKDPNTSDSAKRKLTITMVFTPDKRDKDLVTTDIDVKPTLSPILGVGTRFIIDRDNDGNIVAAEWGKEIKGQMSIDDADEEVAKNENVIDYQRKVN